VSSAPRPGLNPHGDDGRRPSCSDFRRPPSNASLYWFTNTISTSFRPYYERGHGLAPKLDRVQVPTAVALFPADLGVPVPRRWVERRYHLVRYTPMPRGGHFPAYEEPELLAGDVTAFFQQLAQG
jgi:pimeloyl-ACP methyl ester carboxylesterase